MRLGKKRRISGVTGIMAAAILLAGCGGRDVQNMTAPEETEIASQLPQ